MFPISREKNVLLDHVKYLNDREVEARRLLECVRVERHQIVDQIRHGFATTGCAMTNFILIACEGVGDEEVLEQYKQFEADIRPPVHTIQKYPRILLTVQVARCVVQGELTHVRLIHLGTLAGRGVQYSVSNSLLDIAVDEAYYVRSESMNSHTGITSVHEGLGLGEWLTLGPLRNKLCRNPMAHRNGDEYRVPYGTVFNYALHPVTQKQLKDMHMDQALLGEYMHHWTRLKTTYIRRS